MRASFKSLTIAGKNELLHDLNYLNLGEIKRFCRRHSIPIAIRIECADRKKTNEMDRKGVILDRIRHFLNTGEVLPPTCFPAKVVCFDPVPAKPRADDRLFYGQYDKSNSAMIGLLKRLTKEKFRDGALARVVAREFWSKGEAPTFTEYAAAWLRAGGKDRKPYPEWAFLADRTHGTAGPDWKRLRAKKGARIMKILNAVQQ